MAKWLRNKIRTWLGWDELEYPRLMEELKKGDYMVIDLNEDRNLEGCSFIIPADRSGIVFIGHQATVTNCVFAGHPRRQGEKEWSGAGVGISGTTNSAITGNAFLNPDPTDAVIQGEEEDG